MNVVVSLGWIGVMLVIGMIFRAKVKMLGTMLVPSSVIGGIIGFFVMNATGGLPGTDFAIYTTIVTQLFTLSFISIGLTAGEPVSQADAAQTSRSIFQGTMGIAFVWNILYALTPVVGYYCILATGGFGGMDPQYGFLIPFAFAQGPGQSVMYGSILEAYGLENAAMVGVTFAVIGCLQAFVIGVPLAKAGLRRGLGVYSKAMSPSMAKGIFEKEEQTESMVHTCHSGNIDTLGFHMALVGLSYVLTYLVTLGVTVLIEGSGSIMWGVMFMTGMLMSYLVKFVMKKLNIQYVHDNSTQKRITGWATDFVVVASFMSVQVSVIGRWAVPILFTCLIVGILTYFICLYFGRRFGGVNDFERTLGLYGTATGTVPMGIALIRIVDPDLKTTSAVELGASNLPEMVTTVTVLTIIPMVAGTFSVPLGMLLLLAPIPVYLVIMKLCKAWGKPTFSLRGPGVKTDAKGEDL